MDDRIAPLLAAALLRVAPPVPAAVLEARAHEKGAIEQVDVNVALLLAQASWLECSRGSFEGHCAAAGAPAAWYPAL